MAELLYRELSEKVLGMAFSVHNILVTRCLFLTAFGPNTENPPDSPQPFERQRVYPLHYKGELVGAYIADLMEFWCFP